MDGELFDELTRSISSAVTSRRRLLAGVALGSLLTATGASRVQATAFRCKDVGAPCRRGRSCCSGRCGGPNGSKTCSAHDPGICLTNQDTWRARRQRQPVWHHGRHHGYHALLVLHHHRWGFLLQWCLRLY